MKSLLVIGSLLVVALLAAVVPALALDDVAGWQATTWGMTEDEVRRAMPNELHEISPPRRYATDYALLGTTFMMDRFSFDVVLQFSRETRGLRQVLVQAHDAEPTRWLAVRDVLVEKYGPPHRQVGDKISWLFPSTAIELSRYADPILRMTTIRYYPSAAFKEDKGRF